MAESSTKVPLPPPWCKIGALRSSYLVHSSSCRLSPSSILSVLCHKFQQRVQFEQQLLARFLGHLLMNILIRHGASWVASARLPPHSPELLEVTETA